MARGYTRYTASFAVQASAAITADALSGGSKTQFDTQTGGNCDGCEEAVVEIDVTSGPSSAARCQIYIEPQQQDGVGDAALQLAGSETIPTGADKYSVAIRLPVERGNIVLKAIDYAFTAAAVMKGKYPADV